MKRCTLGFVWFALLLPAFLFSQGSNPKLKLTWGQDYELPKGHFDLGFIGNKKDGFVQISHQYGKSLSLQRFSPSLKLTSEKLIDLKGMAKGYMVEDFIQWGGQTYWLYSTWDKPAKREHLYVQKIDVVKGDLAGTAQQLIETDKVLGSGVALMSSFSFNYQATGKYKVSFSSDSNKLFIYVKYPHEFKDDAKDYEEYGLWVFDRNFKVLWAKQIKMPYTEKKITIKDVQCDRQGDYMFLVKVYNDDTRKDIRDNAPNFHFEILKYETGASKPNIIPFDFGDKYVAQLELIENTQGDIICCGFYGEKDQKGKLRAIDGKVDGSFFMKLNQESNKLEKIHKGFYEIPQSVFKEYVSDKTAKKIDKKAEKGEDMSENNLELRHVIFGDDGSLMLLGEQYYSVTVTYRDGNMTYTRTTYYYLDIIAQYIDANGNEAWTKKIPKRQISQSSFGFSFKIMPYNGFNYVFFIDNLKNLNLAKDEAPAVTGPGGVLMGVRLDKTGNMQKFEVFDPRELKERIDIVDADQLDANTLIDRVWKKKVSKICLMEIN